MVDEECVVCGTIQPTGYQGCITCANLWTDDEYSVCGGCDFSSACSPP